MKFCTEVDNYSLTSNIYKDFLKAYDVIYNHVIFFRPLSLCRIIQKKYMENISITNGRILMKFCTWPVVHDKSITHIVTI